jgi:CheY-like chemotaxis protein
MVSDAGATVLVADDLKEYLSYMKFQYQEAGPYKVLTANNGLEALEILKTEYVTYLITDHDMPGLNGCDLIQEIVKAGIQLKAIIIATGHPDNLECFENLKKELGDKVNLKVTSKQKALEIQTLKEMLKNRWEKV